MGSEWTPTSGDEKTLKDAVSLMPSAVNAVVQNVDKSDMPSRFVLSSNGYFDLRAYVMSGQKFPQNDSTFESLMPPQAFAEIRTFDNNVYSDTKRTMVGIGSSCNEYYNNQLTRLLTAAASAIQYADNATELLTVAEGMNLKYHLDILLQEKYKTQADQDVAFKDSREAALITIAMLKDDAETKKKEVDNITEKLVTFRTTTLALQPGVAALTKKFKTGPVENSSTDPAKKTPYLNQLNAKFNATLEKIEKDLKDARAKYAEWDLKTGLAVGFAFWPGIGWVVMSVMAAQAAALRTAYDSLMEGIAKANAENAETCRVVANVNTMITQCVDIDGKMTTAIKAMEELSLLFGNHATCYEKIAFYLNGTSIGVKSESGTTRRAFVNMNLKKTVTWLADLKSTALEFQKNIVCEVTLTGAS